MRILGRGSGSTHEPDNTLFQLAVLVVFGAFTVVGLMLIMQYAIVASIGKNLSEAEVTSLNQAHQS